MHVFNGSDTKLTRVDLNSFPQLDSKSAHLKNQARYL